MYEVPEEDRKVFLEYLSKKPYIEVAALIARLAAIQPKVVGPLFKKRGYGSSLLLKFEIGFGTSIGSWSRRRGAWT